jgi:hypothetical protein
LAIGIFPTTVYACIAFVAGRFVLRAFYGGMERVPDQPALE